MNYFQCVRCNCTRFLELKTLDHDHPGADGLEYAAFPRSVVCVECGGIYQLVYSDDPAATFWRLTISKYSWLNRE